MVKKVCDMALPPSARPFALALLVLAAACTDDSDGDANDAGSSGAADDDPGDGSESGASDGADTGEPTEPDGAALFVTHCASCHGADAMGTTLAPTNRNPDVGYATFVVRNGRDDLPFDLAMPAFADAQLSDEEVAAIVLHLRTFDNPTTGEALFVEACANCHGADAQGGRVGKDITHEVLEDGFADVLERVREGEGGTNYAARTLFMRAWPAADLSDAEVQMIVDHILGLPLGPDDD